MAMGIVFFTDPLLRSSLALNFDIIWIYYRVIDMIERDARRLDVESDNNRCDGPFFADPDVFAPTPSL